MPVRLVLVCLLLVFTLVQPSKAAPVEDLLILYNHGSSSGYDCYRERLFWGEYGALPTWAREIRGTILRAADGRKYRIQVEFFCSDRHPWYQESDELETCDLDVCRRARAIQEKIEKRAQSIPRRLIFLAGHSAGAWASMLVKRADPGSFNGLILAAPAFLGKRKERACVTPGCICQDLAAPVVAEKSERFQVNKKCDSVEERAAYRRMRIREHHISYLDSTGHDLQLPLDALAVLFPCDAFGWPDDLHFLQGQADISIFPPEMSEPEILPCHDDDPDPAFYKGLPFRFCRKKRDNPISLAGAVKEPSCSIQRIEDCPEKYSALCNKKSHLLHNDFKDNEVWNRDLEKPLFTEWFVGERVVLFYIKQRLDHYQEAKDASKSPREPCSFMQSLYICGDQ